MKKIWNYLKWHVINDFHPGYYLSIALFLTISLSLNYYFDFEDDYLEVMTGYPKFLAYFVFYSVPYFFSIVLFSRFRRREDIFLTTDFWIKSLFAVTILSLDGSLPYLYDLVEYLFDPRIQFWAYKVLVNGISFLTIFIPIVTLYFIHDRGEGHIYGLSARKFDSKPYFLMLAIMLPLIVAVSFNDSFLRQYPMYKVTAAHAHLGVSEWVTVAAYEIAYGLDFVTVELLFRGLLVIGMIKILGRGAVLSMAVLYCFLHFGKPAGEAISSIFGGYILGVIAYETRSVWGGIIVHMGIAWTMELVAFAHKTL